jgi:hypothetical protein
MPGTTGGPNSLPQLVDGNAGLRTQFGTIIPPGAHVAAFVCNSAVDWSDQPYITANLVSTLDAGLKRCRTGRGDYVIVLPGHSESVVDATMLANLKAGSRIVGIGHGSMRPVFRWTATGSQWALSVADVLIAGLNLKLEGANGVVKAILVTGASSIIAFNKIMVASGATNKATIALEYGAGSDDFELIANQFHGTETHNVTDGVKIVSAVAGGRIEDNEMAFSATAANGNVHYTAAAVRQRVLRNYLYNTHTASSVALCFDAVAVDGIVSDNRCGCISTGTATTAVVGIKIGAGVLATFFENYVVNDPLKSGLLSPAVDT